MIKRGNEVLGSLQAYKDRIIPPTDCVEDECVASESLFAGTIRILEKAQLFSLPGFVSTGESSTISFLDL